MQQMKKSDTVVLHIQGFFGLKSTSSNCDKIVYREQVNTSTEIHLGFAQVQSVPLIFLNSAGHLKILYEL